MIDVDMCKKHKVDGGRRHGKFTVFISVICGTPRLSGIGLAATVAG